MFRTIGTGVFSLLLFTLPQAARATTLTSCGAACDGNLFALLYHLESDDGTTSVFDVTLLADTSGNNIAGGVHHINSVAVGLNLQGGSMDTVLDFAPNGAANWAGVAGGLNAGGCDGAGAFICARANAIGFAALAPDAGSATTPYQWTWDVSIPDSTKGGAASVFAGGHGIKIHYSDVKGHLVSQDFLFTQIKESPEPVSATLVCTGLLSLCCFFLRRRTTR
jgi:hypothetical protein